MVFEDLTSSYALLHAHVLSSRDYDQNTLQKGCNKSLETATRARSKDHWECMSRFYRPNLITNSNTHCKHPNNIVFSTPLARRITI